MITYSSEMKTIEHKSNSQNTPHILPSQVSYGVSIVKYIFQTLNSQNTPHILPSQVSYGVSIVKNLEKSDRVIAA